jgi:hypothetical protein
VEENKIKVKQTEGKRKTAKKLSMKEWRNLKI